MLKSILKPLKRLLKGVLHFFVNKAVGYLTAPVKRYSANEVSSLEKICTRTQAGDVLLISGNARISAVVKVLTTSEWSHVVLCVGDRRELLSEEEKEGWVQLYGEDCLKHLVVDADPIKKVHLCPIAAYQGLMIRHCRPEALLPKDCKIICEQALSQLGLKYDVKHILRLLFFFAFPWEILPHALRRFVTDFTLSEDDRICSRILAEAFHSVGYPIRPLEIIEKRSGLHRTALGLAGGFKNRSRSTLRLILGGRLKAAKKRLSDNLYAEISLKHARHITPSDYDLSRFFSILKDEKDLAIDYRNSTIMCRLPEK